MNRRRQIVRHQQQRIQQYAKNSNAHTFFKLLADPALLQRVESVMPEHGKRGQIYLIEVLCYLNKSVPNGTYLTASQLI